MRDVRLNVDRSQPLNGTSLRPVVYTLFFVAAPRPVCRAGHAAVGNVFYRFRSSRLWELTNDDVDNHFVPVWTLHIITRAALVQALSLQTIYLPLSPPATNPPHTNHNSTRT